MEKMPFDHNKSYAKFKAVTRSGKEANICGTWDDKLVGKVEDKYLEWDLSGKTLGTFHPDIPCEFDLFMVERNEVQDKTDSYVDFNYDFIEKGYKVIYWETDEEITQIKKFELIGGAVEYWGVMNGIISQFSTQEMRVVVPITHRFFRIFNNQPTLVEVPNLESLVNFKGMKGVAFQVSYEGEDGVDIKLIK